MQTTVPSFVTLSAFLIFLIQVDSPDPLKVLKKGVKALGGTNIKSFSLREIVRQPIIPRADPPFPTIQATEFTIIDTKNNRLLHEQNYPLGGFHLWEKEIINDKGVHLNLRTQDYSMIQNPSIADYRTLYRKLPHFVLEEAIAHQDELEWIGVVDFQGKKQKVIETVLNDDKQWQFYFDDENALLTKYQFSYVDPVYGDALQEIIFPEYRFKQGYSFPTRKIIRRTGGIEIESKYLDLKINGTIVADAFKIPENFTKAREAKAFPKPEVIKAGKDVYVMQGIFGAEFSILFVAFDEYILVVEALENRPVENISEEIIARIKQEIPNKPIRYLVLTHHHYDHAGGARAYIAQGAIVVCTPENRNFLEQMVRAPFLTNPDALAKSPRKPVFEFLKDKKRVFQDKNHRVELYDIGPYPHADEEIIVYIPEDKFLFNGDFYDTSESIAQEDTLFLDAAIKKLGLQVETVAGVHGPIVPISTMKKSIDERSQLNR